MNELEKRAQAHSKKKDGLSPFCSLSEDSDYYKYITDIKTADNGAESNEEDMATFVKRVTSGNNLVQYVADRIDVVDDKYYIVGYKSDMKEVRFLLGTPGESSSYYNVRHLLKSPYWHISLSLKEELTELYLSKKVNEASYKSGDRYYGGLPADPDYRPEKPARYWKEVTQYFIDTVPGYPEYEIIGRSPTTILLKTLDGKETIDLTKFDALADADEAVEMASHYFDASLFEAKKKKKPFDSINTNAGNVEHNIAMFNKATSPTEAPCTNPVSGPMGEALEDDDILRNHGYRQDNLKPTFEVGDRVAHRWADEYNVGTIKDIREHEGIQYQVEWDYSDGDYVEWLYGDEITHWVDVNEKLTESAPKKETIELEYKNLEFTQYGTKRDVDDWDEWDRCMDWTYEVDKDDLYTFIFESCIDETDFPEAFEDEFDPNNPEHWARFESWLDDNFDAIYTKYEEKILENWEEDAREEAEEEYDPDDYVDWDSMPGGHDDDRYWEDLKEGEEVFMEKYSYGLNEEYKREPKMIDYFEQMNSEEEEA